MMIKPCLNILTTYLHTILLRFYKSFKKVEMENMNSQWGCEIKMKRWWWWVFLARSPRLGWILQVFETHTIRTRLDERWSWKYTLLGIFSAQKWVRKRDENKVFNTYLRSRWIIKVLEPLFPCFDLSWNWKRWRFWSLEGIVLEWKERERDCREMEEEKKMRCWWLCRRC